VQHKYKHFVTYASQPNNSEIETLFYLTTRITFHLDPFVLWQAALAGIAFCRETGCTCFKSSCSQYLKNVLGMVSLASRYALRKKSR